MVEGAVKIPNTIDDEEILIRGILHPFYYSKSKKKLKEQAFLPPRGSNDVSVIRLAYTNADNCKRHSKTLKISSSNYAGMAGIRTSSIRKESNSNMSVDVIFTPLDKNKNLRKCTGTVIYNTDEGLPMHADILYNFKPEQGVNAPREVKVIARKLCKCPPAKYFDDPSPEEDRWTGDDLEL